MARFGMHRGASAPAAPPSAPARADLTVNKAGGAAFAVENPALRLLSVVGSSFFNEPQYYGDAPGAERLAGLSDEATLVVNTAREIAQGDNPRDLLAIALWARTELHVRTTPQVLLAVAAHEPKTKEFVRAYTPRIVQRADELKQVFATYVTLFASGVGANAGNQKLPNALKKGLADAFGRFSPAQLLKYDAPVRPTFRDVLRMVDRGKDRALPQGLYNYLRTGALTDDVAAAVPELAARKALLAKSTLDDEARALVRASHAPWELVLSHFGASREAWESVLPQLGYMALLRNLRNLVAAGVDTKPLAARLAERDAVLRSKQLPFRFYAAYQALASSGAPDARLVRALDDALAHACDVLPRFSGVTVLASDNSGSMSSPVSAKSTMSLQTAANLLAAMALRRSDEGVLTVFGESARQVPAPRDAGLLELARLQASTGVGHATNAHKVVELLFKAGPRGAPLKVDRLVLFSDLQCYDSGHGGASLAAAVARYRREVNPELFVHSVNLAGTGTSAVDPKSPRTSLLSGYSEKVLHAVAEFERATLAAEARASAPEPSLGAAYRTATPPASAGDERSLPTLDDVRARF